MKLKIIKEKTLKGTITSNSLWLLKPNQETKVNNVTT